VLDDDFGFTKRDRIILRELSNDARVSLTNLAKVSGCSVVTAAKLVERLASRLDMRFTLEIDMDRLGFPERHILILKFKKRPDDAFLQDFFKDDRYAQDVYITKGDFDLLVFAAADTPINYIKWETDLAANLSDYAPELQPSEFVFPQLGYVPLNDTFTDFISKEMRADKKDKLILKTLNQNARMGYRELGKLTGINEDTIRYRVFKLVKKGMVRRFTIAVQNPGRGSLLSYFLRYRFDRDTTGSAFPQMRNHYMKEDKEPQLLNSFPMIAPISGSYRSFGMAFGADWKEVFYKGVKWHKILLKKEKVVERHALVLKPIKGLLPLRNLDASSNYRFIWT
jgi:DNA-binding Lrp family transcriptional regulator